MLVRSPLRPERTTVVLWFVMILTHVVIFVAVLPEMLEGQFVGDVNVYSNWATKALEGGGWPVFAHDWVYPAGALLPVMLPKVFGPHLYQVVWFVLILIANSVALWGLIRWGRKLRNQSAAMFWVLTIAIMSPVALLRLEGFTAPAVIIGLLFLATRPKIAGVLLAAATWIKVWPAAVLVSIVIVSTKRWLVVAMGAVVTVVVVAVVWIGGGIHHITSFVNAQNGRPLQIEATLSTPWLWMAVFHVPGAHHIHDTALVTEEITGPGDKWMVDNGTYLMLGVLAAIMVVLVIATKRLSRLTHPMGKEVDLVLVGAFALASAFIVFNKVGSPQYMLWLTPIVAVGLVIRPPDWKVPAILMIPIAVLTTLVFPCFYNSLLDLDPLLAAILGARNLLLVVVLGWSVVKICSAAFVTHPIPLGTRPLGTPIRSTSY
ncbi:glycosyltransferase 87 family protein [Frondihabitans sp. PAMC 28766]|uniref:glycosyltransferase 87 family protein n=1 Tax=Frondihabitans sp. PAMC 28766 TaxID=1795630 RepID=UPI0012FFC11C|nr:glycosyltransferase 87 family protein [Frondihabitans sp. PAMC 28766]